MISHEEELREKVLQAGGHVREQRGEVGAGVTMRLQPGRPRRQCLVRLKRHPAGLLGKLSFVLNIMGKLLENLEA